MGGRRGGTVREGTTGDGACEGPTHVGYVVRLLFEWLDLVDMLLIHLERAPDMSCNEKK